MRVACEGVRDEPEVSGFAVVSRREDDDLFDLSFVRTDCEFHATWEEVPSTAGRRVLCTLSATEAAAALEWLVGEPGRYLVVVCPLSWSEVVEHLLRSSAEVALDRFSVLGACVLVGLRASCPQDLDAAAFLAGLAAGRAWGAVTAPQGDESLAEENRVLAEGLASALSYIDASRLAPAPAAAASQEPVAGRSPREWRAIEHELIQTRRRLSMLQRKYDSLASSRLGSMTLRHWERRKKEGSRG